MKRLWRAGALFVIVLGIGAQFVPTEFPRDNPPAEATIVGPVEVVSILRRACFDCHSNETRWPLYSYVAPLSWVVTADVAGGRSRLNLSDWQTLREGFQRRFARKIVERVDNGEMPMPRYLWLHSGARLSDPEVQTLRAWRDDLNADR